MVVQDPAVDALERDLEWYAEAFSDPVLYGERVLEVEFSEKQKEMIEAIRDYDEVAIAGANSSGKTYAVANYGLWGLTANDEYTMLQISPTGELSKDVFWRDMRALYNGSTLAQEWLHNSEMFNTRIEVNDRRYATMITPGNVIGGRGYHGENVLYCSDEANGVDDELYSAIHGVRASGASVKIVLAGNPTHTGGVFNRAFEEPELGWKTINVSAFDSPNVIALQVPDWFQETSDAPGEIEEDDRRKLAYLVYLRLDYLKNRDRTPDHQNDSLQILRKMVPGIGTHFTSCMWVAERAIEWAPIESEYWFGQVLGQFPEASRNQLFRRSWLRGAAGFPQLDEHARMPIVWGVDPAGHEGQAEWVVYGLQWDFDADEYDVVEHRAFYGETAIEDVAQTMAPYMHRSWWINIDQMGVGDWPTLILRNWAAQWEVPVVGFVSQQKSTNPKQFRDVKAMAYGHLQQIFRHGQIRGITDGKTRRQLQEIHYETTNQGAMAMESKIKMRSRGVDSPDHADALAYAAFPLAVLIPQSYQIQH